MKCPAWLLLSLVLGASAANAAPPELVVSEPWVRMVPQNAATTALFFKLKNGSASDVRLVGAATPAARVAELHEHLHENGMMKMRKVPFIEVKARGEVSFQPGGLHVMLIGLVSPLKAGDKVTVTLQLADKSTLTLTAPVGEGPPAASAVGSPSSPPATAPGSAG
ncbi:MAG: copper chaperone PCu(A)C [Deltaproteobacteria bacterium]|nr:copper chaperone PCu(A)C [Deltaproteobacteria bacterium]